MLAKILAESEGIYDFKLGASDACLDAGLILADVVDHPPLKERYCFQTTHVDERFEEYFEHDGDFRLIWCLRNPLSVVYSLVYNWTRWGLNTTFMRCGAERLEPKPMLFDMLGAVTVDKLSKACMIYNAKVSQIFDLSSRLQSRGFVVVEYDELVRGKAAILPEIYNFLDVDYRPEYAEKILTSSLNKADRLTSSEVETINRLCGPVYERARDEFWDRGPLRGPATTR